MVSASSSSKVKSALIIKEQLPCQEQQALVNKAAPEPYNPKQCPCCKKETMETLMDFDRRGPPTGWKEKAANLPVALKSLHVTVV